MLESSNGRNLHGPKGHTLARHVSTTSDSNELEIVLGVSFRNLELLRQALVHRSYLNENPQYSLGCNERLEFLGDALIGLVVADDLFRRYPESDEGYLTELRAAIVRRESLAQIGRQIELGRFLYLGRGEAEAGGVDRDSNLAGAVEALVAAVLLDRGLEFAWALTRRLVGPQLALVLSKGPLRDIKTRLQEFAQSYGMGLPEYYVVASDGVAHAPEFAVEVMVGGEIVGRGKGRRKADAEREAAREALHCMSVRTYQT